MKNSQIKGTDQTTAYNFEFGRLEDRPLHFKQLASETFSNKLLSIRNLKHLTVRFDEKIAWCVQQPQRGHLCEPVSADNWCLFDMCNHALTLMSSDR